MDWTSECLFPKYSGLKARGGAAIVNINDCVIAIGGVDREQNHFFDVWMIDG